MSIHWINVIARVAFLGMMFGTDTVFAGWAGGGGELLKNANNPWFLENTPSVTYCVIQGKDFSLPASVTENLLYQAIAAWKRELAEVADTAQPIIPGVRPKIGTQEFHAIVCDGSEDIKFQFGSLDQVQKVYLGPYRKYVGAAIRTSYDEEQLRGKGFVYLASDIGQDRYEGEGPNGFWSSEENGLTFYRVLIHELGHVFGVPHLDLNSNPIGYGAMIMEADAPERIVAGLKAVWPFKISDRLSILSPLSNPIVDSMDNEIIDGHWRIHRLLELPNDYAYYIGLRKKDNTHYTVLIERENPPRQGYLREYGTIQIDSTLESAYRPVVAIKLTKAQKVYKQINQPLLEILKFVPGPGFVTTTARARLILNESRIEKPLIVTQGSDVRGIQRFGGILDGKIYTDLNREKD